MGVPRGLPPASDCLCLINVNAIADYMRKGGHACFTTDDGIDALATLKNHPMDLMILDGQENIKKD